MKKVPSKGLARASFLKTVSAPTLTDIRQQVKDYADFLDIFWARESIPEKTMESLRKRYNFRAAAAPDLLIAEVTRFKKDGGGVATSLIVRLHENFDEKKFQFGTLKMSIVRYEINGKTQKLWQPVDLKPLARLMASPALETKPLPSWPFPTLQT